MTSNCTAPPQLTEYQLAMVLEGEADAQVETHLAECAHCRERAADLARSQNSLHALLYRVHCPSSDKFRDYHFDLLDDAEARYIDDHLHHCPHCTHHLADLNQFVSAEESRTEIEEPETSTGPLQRFRQIVAELQQLGPTGLTPAFVGIRGEAVENQLLYQAGDISINIDIEPDPDRPGLRDLLGVVMGGNIEGWTVHLWREQQRLATAAIDDLGSFRFFYLPQADYTLIISGPQVAIHVAEVVVS